MAKSGYRNQIALMVTDETALWYRGLTEDRRKEALNTLRAVLNGLRDEDLEVPSELVELREKAEEAQNKLATVAQEHNRLRTQVSVIAAAIEKYEREQKEKQEAELKQMLQEAAERQEMIRKMRVEF